jgi:hypothetical protein
MDGQRTSLATPVLDREPDAPSTPPAAPRPMRDTPPWRVRPADNQLTTPWAAALGLGWPLAIIGTIALEPLPVDPDAPVPVVIELASLALFAALLATVVAAGIRHRGAAVAGVVVGLLAVTFTVACPVSGHHTMGLWWFGQIGLVGAMLATSLVALGQRSHARAGR